MDRDGIINLVLSRLGKKEGNAYLITAAQLELQHIIQTKLEMGALMPWFILTTELAIVLPANTRTVALPADFLREYDYFPLQKYSATYPSYTEMVKDDYDLNLSWEQSQLTGNTSSSSASGPQRYSLIGPSLAAFPLGTVDTTFHWIYYAKQGVVGNYTNTWTTYAADVLIAELGLVMSKYTRSDLINEFKADMPMAYSRMQTESIARENAARDAYRGN